MKRWLMAIVASLLCSVSWAQSYPTQLNITYVKAPFNLQNIVMKKHGLLEKEFAKEGIRINWIPIKAGLDQVRGLMSGDIDMVAAMNTSTLLMANSTGNRILIADGVAHPDDIFAIVAHKDRSTKAISDLKGKRIVGPKGTVVHHLLVAALVKEGMSIKDVEFISMNLPASLTTLVTGHADAALMVGPGIQKALSQGHQVLTRATGLVDTNLVMSVSERFAKRYPEVVRRVVKVNQEALNWIRNHEGEAIAIGAKEHGISETDAAQLAQWSGFYSGFTEADVQSMKVNQAFLMKEKLMRQEVDVDNLLFR